MLISNHMEVYTMNTIITKKIPSGKPKVSANKATVGKLNTSAYMAIDPSSTPNSAYMKKTK